MNIEDALRDGLGSDIVTCRPDLLERRHRDWSGLPGQPPVALIRPRSTEDVSRALRICHANAQPVVMQGGMTGLAGGACTSDEDVAMTLERMNRILEVDPVSSTITVEAGATLEAVQEAAAAAGLMFPLDLGARGSCTIGGNLATNAGGNRVIKYGTAREQVLGIEAVLADGTVISSLHKMIKNNTGYDLKDLLIGSEGTLGIITKAVLRLRPKAGSVLTAWCGLKDYDAVTTLLGQAQMSLEGGVSAFEVMWPSFVDYIVGHVNGVRAPLESRHNFYVLLESTGMDGESTASRFENFLTEMMEARVIEDASVAQSHADAADFGKCATPPLNFLCSCPT